MPNAMVDARPEGDSYRRVEVITGERRRRQWTGGEKARIVSESLERDANISEVARRNGVSRGLLTVWRRRFAAAVAGEAPSFVPVQIGDESADGTADESKPHSLAQARLTAPPTKICGVVEIEVSGARVRVEPGVELRTLSMVLSALRGIR